MPETVLGIETSGRTGSIAVARDGELLSERSLSASGRRHARTLIPEIGELLASLGLTLGQIDAIAVSLGPGSFTGLRVGAVCAKTLAYALNVPVIGVDTFLSIAESMTELQGDLFVIDDALRGDVFAGHYRRIDLHWRCLDDPKLLSLEVFRTLLTNSTPVTGPGVIKLEGEFELLNVIDDARCQPAAGGVAAIGARKLKLSEVDDFWTLEPRYIRRSAAEEKAAQSM